MPIMVDHMTVKQISPKVKFVSFSVFSFSLDLVFDQILSNLIVYLMISQKLHIKFAQRASMLQWIPGRFHCL